jgi:hypothetical protein
MALEQFSNNAVTTLDGAVDGSTNPVSVTVDDASDFPTSGNFRIIIDTEILLVTAVAGNVFTCTRAQEGTTIAAHSDGAAVTHLLTAASLRAIVERHSWWPYQRFTPTGVDDEFDDENFSGWTAVGTAPIPSTTEYQSQLAIYHPGGDTSEKHYAWMKSATVSVGDYIEICFRVASHHTPHAALSLIFANGATYGAGTQMVCTWIPSNGVLYTANMTNYNNWVETSTPTQYQYMQRTHQFLRLTMTATNTWKVSVSVDGVYWATISSGTVFALTPTHVGFGVSRWGASAGTEGVYSIEYFRKGS